MTTDLKGISSMATRLVLADLVTAFEQQSDCRVAIESVGRVDAARRVQAGEAFDFVVLAADALSNGQMQRIAREFALSETVFVRAPRTPGAPGLTSRRLVPSN